MVLLNPVKWRRFPLSLVQTNQNQSVAVGSDSNLIPYDRISFDNFLSTMADTDIIATDTEGTNFKGGPPLASRMWDGTDYCVGIGVYYNWREATYGAYFPWRHDVDNLPRNWLHDLQEVLENKP